MWPAAHSIDDLLNRKPLGFYRIQSVAGRHAVTINRVGEAEEVIFCLSAGHANQVRQLLTDAGLAGFVEGAA